MFKSISDYPGEEAEKVIDEFLKENREQGGVATGTKCYKAWDDISISGYETGNTRIEACFLAKPPSFVTLYKAKYVRCLR